jgi:prepilin-type N-terminal cleavage/methylation domain-containing protein
MRIVRDERGVTLTELLAAMAVAVVLFGAAVTTFVTFLGTSTRSDQEAQAQDTARSTIERITSQLRNAMSTGATGSQPIQSVSDFNLVFLAPANNVVASTTNPRGLAYYRYCLGNVNNKSEQLWHQTAAYHSTSQATAPATSTCPDVAWPNKIRVASHVINRSAPVTPLFVPTTVSGEVTQVAINARVDWNMDTRPVATELRSEASVRNLNRGPTAALSCQGLAGGRAVCDASGSSDPDGHALGYGWKVDTTTLATEKTYRLDYSPLSKGNHSVTVTVTDSGGTTSTMTRSVVIP